MKSLINVDILSSQEVFFSPDNLASCVLGHFNNRNTQRKALSYALSGYILTAKKVKLEIRMNRTFISMAFEDMTTSARNVIFAD
jgi:hypothetical protein